MSIAVTETIDIDAPMDEVWRVLVDFPAHREWSAAPIEGRAVVGSRISIGTPGMGFRPVVTVVEPGRELRWIGTLGWRGILRGEHSFVLSANEDGTTRLVNHEDYTGALVTLARPLMGASPGTRAGDNGYAAFNRALKRRVESLRSS